MASASVTEPGSEWSSKLWTVKSELYGQVGGHVTRLAGVTTPVLSAAASVKGLKDEPAGYAARVALLNTSSAPAVASGWPARVLPSVIAFGLKTGALARAHTAP